MMRSRILVVALLGCLGGIAGGGLAGCAKQADLPDVVVSASSPEEFAQFRTELGTRFGSEQLQPFDTATQELKLDALNREVPAGEREADMRAKINGRTVHVATVLGWRAREARFLREIAEVQKILADAQQAKDRAAANGTTAASSVGAQIQSAGTVLDQLHRNLAETGRRLAEWDSAKK